MRNTSGLCSSLHQTDTLYNSFSQTVEGTHEESGGGCSGCVFRGVAVLSVPTKPEPGLERFPFTQDQLGSINGFGVDQLMSIAFHCCDSVCTDNPTHISAFAPLWCNADVYTHVLVCVFSWGNGPIINAALSNSIKLQTRFVLQAKNSLSCVYCDTT